MTDTLMNLQQLCFPIQDKDSEDCNMAGGESYKSTPNNSLSSWQLMATEKKNHYSFLILS